MKITDKYSAVIPVDEPSPVGFLNLYDEGDAWIKIQGCEACPVEQRIKCCGDCPCIMPDGRCYWQSAETIQKSRKTFYCIITPLPKIHNSRCCIEYKCIEGKKKGKIRRLKDKLNVFV